MVENVSKNINVEEYTRDIQSECSELSRIAEEMRRLQPVSHLSKSRIQWRGGIIGAIQENGESNRLIKLINSPIYGDKSFYNLAFIIIETTQSLVNKQLEVQRAISSDNPLYFDNVRSIISTVRNVIEAWFQYSPDLALASITIDDEKDVALNPTVHEWTKTAIAELDSPLEYQSFKVESEKPNSKESSGCFGILLLLLSSSMGLLGVASYGIYQLLA